MVQDIDIRITHPICDCKTEKDLDFVFEEGVVSLKILCPKCKVSVVIPANTAKRFVTLDDTSYEHAGLLEVVDTSEEIGNLSFAKDLKGALSD